MFPLRPRALGLDEIAAAQQVEQWNREWDELRATQAARAEQRRHGTLAWLIDNKYRKSSWYLKLAASTRGEADRHLTNLADSPLGKRRVRDIGRSACRNIYETVVARRGAGVAREFHKWMRRAFSYVVELELLAVNPAAKMEITGAKLRKVRWTAAELEAFDKTALEMGYHGWALAVRLGYETSADLGVLLQLTWKDFDGEGLEFTRFKVDVEQWVPLTKDTIQVLDETNKRGVRIITDDKGRPIPDRSRFGKPYRKIRAASKIRPELGFKDLRRTAITEAESAGAASEPLSGHQPGSPVKKHYVIYDKDDARRTQRARFGEKVEMPKK